MKILKYLITFSLLSIASSNTNAVKIVAVGYPGYDFTIRLRAFGKYDHCYTIYNEKTKDINILNGLYYLKVTINNSSWAEDCKEFAAKNVEELTNEMVVMIDFKTQKIHFFINDSTFKNDPKYKEYLSEATKLI